MTKTKCTECRGEGNVIRFDGWKPCPVCKGTGEAMPIIICECNHDQTQHVERKGVCLASDRLGFSVCRCKMFVDRESSGKDSVKA